MQVTLFSESKMPGGGKKDAAKAAAKPAEEKKVDAAKDKPAAKANDKKAKGKK